jgi:uncharacterized protein YeeX (DUF496 family)
MQVSHFFRQNLAVSFFICIFAAGKNKTIRVNIMSTTALTNLRDYLTGTLSPDDMMWLVEEMKNFMRGKEGNLKPYTIEEIHAMIEESERDIAEGRVTSHEEVMREWEEELAREEQEALDVAKAV